MVLVSFELSNCRFCFGKENPFKIKSTHLPSLFKLFSSCKTMPSLCCWSVFMGSDFTAVNWLWIGCDEDDDANAFVVVNASPLCCCMLFKVGFTNPSVEEEDSCLTCMWRMGGEIVFVWTIFFVEDPAPAANNSFVTTAVPAVLPPLDTEEVDDVIKVDGVSCESCCWDGMLINDDVQSSQIYSYINLYFPTIFDKFRMWLWVRSRTCLQIWTMP